MFPLLCWWFCPGSPSGLASRLSQRGPASVSRHVMITFYLYELLSYTLSPVLLLFMRPRNRIYHQPSGKVDFFLQFTDVASFQNVLLVHPCQRVYKVGLGRAASTEVNVKQMERSVIKEITTEQERVICMWACSPFKNIMYIMVEKRCFFVFFFLICLNKVHSAH